ncbi:MAG TPA: hypothetical protein QF683_11245, partial [SAR324 cluster bacterium]|nr:hypothetical protein [SAR324 cluster bacterium]
MNYINSLIYGFKKCFFILFLAFFIWGCDSSETQEEDGSLNVSNNPGGTDDDEVTQFEVSVVTPISTIT